MCFSGIMVTLIGQRSSIIADDEKTALYQTMPDIRHFKLSNGKIIFLMSKDNMFNLTAGNGNSKVCGTGSDPKTLGPGLHGSNQIIALCVILVCTLPAPAQDQAGETIEEITVIGSHIKMDPKEALVPVTSIIREELRYQGSPTVLDMILNLPFSQGADGESDRFQGGGGGGSGVGPDQATINIRGLGPSRSLVLINGRRTTWSPIPIGADTQLLVDVNMLPFIALENIDFLRDGAAASYGSDAIAGVMNFETRSDFTGIELGANHKVIRDSGGDTEVGFIGGMDFAGGRGHITTSASGIRRSELEIYRRDWAIRPYEENPKGGWSSTGRPATFISGNTTDVNTNGIIDPNCAALGGAPTSSNKRCRFQYTPFDNLVEKTRRWQSFTEASWELSDAVTLSTEFLYSESRVPDWNTSPSYPPNRVIDPERSLRANNPALDPESAVSFNVGLLLDHDDLLADNDGLSMPVKT